MLKPRDIALIALFTALTAVGAYIAIPLSVTPVPITFQVLFVLLSAIVLGKYRAMISQVAYVLLGVIGIPVFAKGTGGIGHLFGPTGGYFWGFIAAAFVVGWLAELNKSKKFEWYMAACFIGVIIIYAFGVPQLMFVAKYNIVAGLVQGVGYFIVFDILKIIVACYMALALQRTGAIQFEY